MKNKLKVHSKYEFYDNDKVFVENSDGTFSFFILSYQESVAAWVLIPYKDEYFKEPISDNKNVECEFLYEYGIDCINHINEFNYEEEEN
jgi:hypothetical protein